MKITVAGVGYILLETGPEPYLDDFTVTYSYEAD